MIPGRFEGQAFLQVCWFPRSAWEPAVWAALRPLLDAERRDRVPTRSVGTRMLGKQFLNDVAVADDRDRPAGVGVIFLGVVDAERRVERRGHVVGREAFVLRGRGRLVRFAEHLAALHAAAGHQHEHAPRIVVAAAFGIAAVDLRRAAEFAGDEDGGRVEQTLLGQAVEQRRQTGVELRQQTGLQLASSSVVRVPAAERERDEPHARFDQPRGRAGSSCRTDLRRTAWRRRAIPC